jgi:PST family polysaccharide transporter
MSEHQRMATNVNRGLAWIGVASSLVGILDLLAILVILNFWITPEEYGVATKVIWLFPILDQATDLGLSAAVIQRDDHSDAKISTVFWINLGTASVLFAGLAIITPMVARPIIAWMLIAYGTKLLWQNVYFIPVALMKRELRFKELSIIRIIANLAEFAGKIGFAAAGFGVWCFVLGPMGRVLVTGVGAQLRHPWRPKLVLRLREAKEYVTFGLKSSGSQILFYFYTNIDYPIVGYFFGDVALGFYRLAYEVVLEPVRMISNVIVDIAFPAFAKLRYEPARVIAQFVSFTRLNLITVMTYSAIVLVAADDVLAVIFPSYVAAAPAVRILCAVAVLRAVSFVIPPLLDGMGRPDRTFTYTLSAAIVLPISYVAFAAVLGDHLGYESVAIAWAVGYPVAFTVLAWLAVYTLDWSIGAYLKSVRGVVACMAAAGLVGWGVHWLLAGQLPAIRLVLVAITIAGVTGLLLAYTQGISLRTAMRSMRGES